ncbi:hypothetical protein [Pseudomonas sp. RGM 3321]|uniref:hypothetical protein n=1 Tax=Pseudomonas sp. RGM 3321 TaxID=2930089 RepID=UPI001FCB6317|nr:hypothetical protein [Pseudomonas sp. RGM 3321]MCJ2373811.1 hypothetical protein [Pseudomonas sp. RGM 3321]
MTELLVQQGDLKDLMTYLQVLQRLATLTRSFKVHLDQVPAPRHSSYPIPDIQRTLKIARSDLSGWLAFLPDIKAVQRSLDVSVKELLNAAASDTQGEALIAQLMGAAGDRLLSFENAFDHKQQTLETLKQGVCKVLPRVMDFMNTHFYSHARQHGLTLEKQPSTVLANSLPLSFDEPGAVISPEERLLRAQGYAFRTQQWYVLAYTAAANLGAYLLRMWSLLWACLGHIVEVRRAEKPSRRRLESRLLIINLNEIQRLSRGFDAQQANAA